MGLINVNSSWGQSEETVTISLGSSVQGCEQTNDCFTPNILNVKQGDKVVWINEDTEPHVIVSGSTSFGPDGKFQSETISPGATFSVTFDKEMEPDAYFYYDPNFLWMEGIIVLEESETSPPTPTQTMNNSSSPINKTQGEKENEVIPNDASKDGGGCLIATAAFGSELSPQVQKLRELRDNTILKTSSGSQFMSGFNQFYYLFSPVIADWERENLFFKEVVKGVISPLLATLSILPLLDIDSEFEVIGYGIGIISLNLFIYFVIPTLALITIKRKFQSKKIIKILN